MEDLFAEARRVIRALPLDEIRAAGVQLDRVHDNPEAARYFLAYADWTPSNPDEIFASPDAGPAGYTQVYVDLPFCPTVCNFCAFYPVIARGEQMDVYVTSLQREIQLIADVYFSRGYEAGALELGGGTPTHLPPDLLAVVVNALTRNLPFRVGAERNCETTPEEILGQVGAERLRILRDAGFDRISIGAQSFSDKVLKAAKRSHGSAEITRAVDAARAVGFRRVNFDILVGLLDQTVEDFLASIERSIELDIDIIEIYAMRYFDTKQPVPLTKRYLDQPQRFITEDDLLLARVAADIRLR